MAIAAFSLVQFGVLLYKAITTPACYHQDLHSAYHESHFPDLEKISSNDAFFIWPEDTYPHQDNGTMTTIAD